MLTLIRKFLCKSGRSDDNQESLGGAQSGADSGPNVPTVETVRLSLAAILERFPDELKSMIERMPGPEVTVALPVPTILKQLPTGSVKMSLASMHRQAPQGVFKRNAGEERRMIEVPLAEVLKRVRPELLQRRIDQRQHRLPENGFNLFGDKSNPYALSPTEPVEERRVQVKNPALQNTAKPERVLKMPAAERQAIAGRHPSQVELGNSVHGEPATAPEQDAEAADLQGPPILVPITELAANWPELIKSEVATMNGANVALPASELSAGLAKGRVTFSWGKLRNWITPGPAGSTEADDATELQLPLRVVAPAYLKQSQRAEQQKQTLPAEEEIPALFHSGDAEPEIEITPASEQDEPSVTPTGESSIEIASSDTTSNVISSAPDPQGGMTECSAEVQNAANTPSLPQNAGELFGQPSKSNWSPGEIVENVVKLRGVTGAMVALQEGLVVANRLPEGMNAEAFAAFLPQIFARLNQYTGEMRLGEVGELLLQASGAQCKVFRLGEVFFAALGQPGEALPSADLQLCARELNK
jgi:predicted regulator of Ras-like GTPase activity (Roadblock/LC7/MglB family)